MRQNTLLKKWGDGESVLGLWLVLNSPIIARNFARSGADYCCIDMQHGLADYADALAMLMAMEGQSAEGTDPAVPLVRVPWNEPGIIGRVLDAGAMGVIVPMVNTAEQARAAVAACKYPPLGARSHGPIVASAALGPDYDSQANEHTACIVMIETVEAVQNLDEICAVEGVSGLYLGPSDMARSLGQLPQADNVEPEFMEVANKVVAAAEAHGIAAGIHASEEIAPARLEMGFLMATVTTDSLAVATAGSRAIASVRGNAHKAADGSGY